MFSYWKKTSVFVPSVSETLELLQLYWNAQLKEDWIYNKFAQFFVGQTKMKIKNQFWKKLFKRPSKPPFLK